MDRRTTLAKLLGKANSDKDTIFAPASTTVLSGLDPYTGPFEFEQAAHLLRRTVFGPTYQQIKDARTSGLEATLDQLLADQPLPSEPVNHRFTDEPAEQRKRGN